MSSYNREKVTSPVQLKNHRIRKQSEYEFLKRSGQRLFVNDWLLINYIVTPTADSKVGWTIPKGVGGAVVRNRLKRWSRELLRKWLATSTQGVSLQLVFFGRNKDLFSELQRSDFDNVFEMAARRLQKRIAGPVK